MMRQIGKQILTLLIGLALAPGVMADTLTNLVVADPLTGVAMDGYDPVSYFVEPAPLPGSPDFSTIWQGVPWYFASAANRDVFVRNPEVYAPQYGGHGLMALSRGYLSDGNPQLYAVEGLKLYFFYSSANREAFLMDRASALKAAAQNWPKLSLQLDGPKGEEPVTDEMASVAPAGAVDNLQSN